jgi:hypothetical protein
MKVWEISEIPYVGLDKFGIISSDRGLMDKLSASNQTGKTYTPAVRYAVHM